MVHQVVERSTKIKTKGFVSGEDLLNQLDDLHPVGVFVDIELSESRTGLTFFLNKNKMAICSNFVTYSPTELNISRALNSGADDFVRKPLIPDEVNARPSLEWQMLHKRPQDVVNQILQLILHTEL